MVRIAIAGGSGEVAREVIDALVAASDNDDIIIFSQNDMHSQSNNPHGLSWRKVDYNDSNSLVQALRDIHTVLSFIQLLHDPENKSQKNLIDAAILAGVKRFAPSEWGSRGAAAMPWWAGKDDIKEYLKQVNTNKKVLEYTLFQPGLFMNYLATPFKTSSHLTPLNTFIDLKNQRAVMVDGYSNAALVLTTVQDMAAVVARAVHFEGQWPVVGGIRGNRVTISQLLEIGKRVRDGSFTVETVKLHDLEAGRLNTSWTLEARHHSVSTQQETEMLKSVLVGVLVSTVKGGWDVSDEWNQLLPDYKFSGVEEFLEDVPWDAN
ncbi:NmrA-like family-domain-containing protein [Bombardia bombarda]|uniref:NmrA-like family-domain-containing protein n=1 Tax=Bombardia bombarda TaxID=252184 RepID=A0AA39XCG7_9PEZI|nr:NmrA-like family-domain-containing protein [Bombardia bombarda]